jgi:hypothetical protein
MDPNNPTCQLNGRAPTHLLQAPPKFPFPDAAYPRPFLDEHIVASWESTYCSNYGRFIGLKDVGRTRQYVQWKEPGVRLPREAINFITTCGNPQSAIRTVEKFNVEGHALAHYDIIKAALFADMDSPDPRKQQYAREIWGHLCDRMTKP